MTIRTMRVTKRVVAAVATAALGATLLALPTSPVGATSTVTDIRLQGVDREATSVDISANAGNANTNKFVLVNSRSYPDAVTASALAGSVQGSIITLPGDGSLSAAAKARLANATDVWIVGGTDAVPATVEAAVQAASVSVVTSFTRIAGTDRFDTMKKVAAAVGAPGTLASKKTVFLANAYNFADAVTASPAAYAGPHQMLLTGALSLNAVTKATITSLGATQVVILGGTAAISAAVAAEVDAMTGVSVIRVAGEDRYETAKAFADLLIQSTGTGGFGWSAGYVGLANIAASGDGADALAASAYLGTQKTALLGLNNGSVPAATTAFLTANKAVTSLLTVFGGLTAVPNAVLSACEAAAGLLGSPTATIVVSEKAAAATVVFSENVSVASVAAGDFQLLGLNGVAFANIAGVSVVDAANGVGKTVVIQFTDGTLNVVGVKLQLIPGTIVTADNRAVIGASATITDDATAPTSTMSAVIGTAGGDSDKFSVSFSEPVTGVLNAADFKINTVAVTAATFAYTGGLSTSVLYTGATATITTPAALGEAQVVSLNAGAVNDPAGNLSGAASTSVTTDGVKPTLTSATLAVAATTTAQVVSGGSGLLFQAKTAGVAGNAISVDFEAEAGATTLVTVAAAGGVTTITVTPKTAATGAEVAASIRANATANALVEITVLVAGAPGGGYIAVAADPLVGGTTKATVTSTFSENVSVTTVNQIVYDPDGANPITGMAAATAVATGNVVVSTHLLTAADLLPVINQVNVQLSVTSVADSAGNPIAVAARTF